MMSSKKLKASGRLAVDTNAVIAYREGISEVCTLIDEADVIILPVTVLGELLYGALNSTKIEKNEQVIQIFAAYSLVMQVDEAVATRYAKVRFNLKKNGTPIPENDIWVAAACLELEVPLLSRDGHFKYVKGLDVYDW
ncbi:MAG: type II toxin-antitoxin system VapC family toxin [Methanosarcinales archaeon]|nr:type II toxin-antitoxin system VapC family toxin [Methanosarcinales archaeon]